MIFLLWIYTYSKPADINSSWTLIVASFKTAVVKSSQPTEERKAWKILQPCSKHDDLWVCFLFFLQPECGKSENWRLHLGLSSLSINPVILNLITASVCQKPVKNCLSRRRKWRLLKLKTQIFLWRWYKTRGSRWFSYLNYWRDKWMIKIVG